MIHRRIQSIFHPEKYHGWGLQRKFFEGWYYKIINEKEDRALAIIPGVAMDENGKQQSFIQVLDGIKRTAEYHKFAFHQFKPVLNKFEIQIDNNFFSKQQIELNLSSLQGKLSFYNLTPWPSSLFSPGIMGPYSFVPFMECYHGILSLDHIIEGSLCFHNEEIDFTNGRGYMEKDWGHSFPEGYCWMQSNHFSEPGISVKSSVAKIPWIGSSFVGFIAGVWLQNHLVQFTTYNGSRLIKSVASHEKVEQVMENRNYRLELYALREAGTALAAPVSGFMDGKIEESMTARIELKLTDKNHNIVLLNDTGRNACLEVAGKVSEITIE